MHCRFRTHLFILASGSGRKSCGPLVAHSFRLTCRPVPASEPLRLSLPDFLQCRCDSDTGAVNGMTRASWKREQRVTGDSPVLLDSRPILLRNPCPVLLFSGTAGVITFCSGTAKPLRMAIRCHTRSLDFAPRVAASREVLGYRFSIRPGSVSGTGRVMTGVEAGLKKMLRSTCGLVFLLDARLLLVAAGKVSRFAQCLLSFWHSGT